MVLLSNVLLHRIKYLLFKNPKLILETITKYIVPIIIYEYHIFFKYAHFLDIYDTSKLFHNQNGKCIDLKMHNKLLE